MAPYTTSYLHQNESDNKGENNDENNNNSEEKQKNKLMESEYYNYNLRGIVIHQGTSESGHYYSLVKDRESWMEVNDRAVRQIDEAEISHIAFGGDEKVGDNEFGKVIDKKNRNAYLLFYQRDRYYDEEGKRTQSLIDQEKISNKSDTIL